MVRSSAPAVIVCPGRAHGVVRAPANKSALQRALLLASVADGASILRQASYSGDVRAVTGVAEALQARLHLGPTIHVQPSVHMDAILDTLDLHVGESGFALRSLATFGSLWADEIWLHAKGTLLKRPLKPVAEWLEPLGLKTNKDLTWPLNIQGQLKSGTYQVDASWSSQMLSGLLMSMPLVHGDSIIEVRRLVSGVYIDLTIDIMRRFGIEVERDRIDRFYIKGDQQYQGTIYDVEGDWSGAANLLVAGALSGSVTVDGLRLSDHQADTHILQLLDQAGAACHWLSDASITVSKDQLRAFSADLRDCPDLFPPALVLALGCIGRSELHGANRLVHKESDRATTLIALTEALGGEIRRSGDTLIIEGRGRLRGGTVHSLGDHRIAMAAATAACIASDEVMIEDAKSVNKSYPAFYEDITRLGIEVRTSQP